MFIRHVLPIAAFALMHIAASAQSAYLDTQFNHSGILRSNVGLAGGASSCLFTADSKLIVAGNTILTSGSTAKIFFQAYTDNADIATSFGSAGAVTDSFNAYGSDNRIIRIVAQPDGRILALGSYFDTNYDNHYALTRRNADGSRDVSFGDNGIVECATDLLSDIKVQADGKIVVSGTYKNGTHTAFMARRFKATGAVDSTFGTNGVATVTVGTAGQDAAGCIAIQSDGKIVLGGSARFTTYMLAAIVRLNANGTVDSSFGTAYGASTTVITGISDHIVRIALNPDNSIIAIGNTIASSSAPADNEYFILKFTAGGIPDYSFSGDSKIIINNGPGDDVATALAIQPDGKVVVAGYTVNDPTSDHDYSIYRFTASGSPDNTFGMSGYITNDLTDSVSLANDQSADMAIEANGKIVIVGSTVMSGRGYIGIVKYLRNNTLGIASLPVSIDLSCYPNPFTDKVTLSFTITQPAAIAVTLTDITGRHVSTLFNTTHMTGEDHTLQLHMPTSLIPGNYLLTMYCNGQPVANKILTHH